jgi:hypothetical protein
MTKSWRGVVKIKVLHRPGATVLLPEAVIVTGARDQWVQPQWVYAPLLAFTDDHKAHATIHIAAVDPSRRDDAGLRCAIEFTSEDRLTVLPDRSEVYRCRITSEYSLNELTVGRGRLRDDGGINLRLYHHTAPATLPLIHQAGHVRGSAWNYQGTRELANVAYAYFTNLERVTTERDLQSIAMASSGRLPLLLDSTPTGRRPDLELTVYRGSTRDRQASLRLWVPAEVISTPHIWQHTGRSVEYEIVHPWIHRIGLQPDSHLDFRDREATPYPAALKRFEYAVIGDCTTLSGLEAPFDEENTEHTFVVQDLGDVNLFDFWRHHSNTPLHAPPSLTQQFKLEEEAHPSGPPGA